MKRVAFLLMIMTLLICVFPMNEAEAATFGELTYKIENGGAIVTDCNESYSYGSMVIIPDTLGGYPVTGIGDSAFYYCTNTTTVVIPDTVTSIGKYAFESCRNLTSINIPDGVTEIGSGAFEYCRSLTDIHIPAGVKTIEYRTFYGCNSLTDITVPDGVTSVGDYAFYCSNLEEVRFTGDCPSFEDDSFYLTNAVVYYPQGASGWANVVQEDLGGTLTWKSYPLSVALKKVDGVWKYYVNGNPSKATTLCKHSGLWYYVNNGVMDTSFTGLYRFKGTYYYVKNGKVDTAYTGLVKYNNEWWYVVKGKIASKTTSLVKYNNEWWYVVKGKIAAKTTTLVKHNGSWYYIVKGKLAAKTTTLVKYSGKWYYVENGCVSNKSTLCQLNGVWYHVNKGTITKETTLCSYDGEWYYVKNGVFSESTLFFRFAVDNRVYYVKDGVVMTGTSGQVVVGGKTYYVKNGVQTNCHSAGHSFAAATCQKPKTCTKCTATQGGTASHTYSKGKCQVCQQLAPASEYAYMAGNDFRRIRYDYSSAEALGAYVVIFTDYNGDVCVLTHVTYKIISNYSETTLHNLTRGTYVVEPADYYERLSNRSVGATKLMYLMLKGDVLKNVLICQRGIMDMWTKGTHSGEGVYVDAATLNQ